MAAVKVMLDNLTNQTKGTIYCIVGVLSLTPDSLLVRKVSHLPNFTVQFYRYLFYAIFIAYFFILQEKSKTIEKCKELGPIGLIAGLNWGVSNVLVTMAFQKTAIANALVILAVNPMWSAIFSYFLLGEKIPIRTVIAALVCFGAIILIFSSELGKENSGIDGVFCALFASITMGLYFVLLRLATIYQGKDPDMMPCNIIAGLFAALGSSILYSISIVLVALCASGDLTVKSGTDMVYLFIQGGLVLPISFGLLTIGPSLISAPEVSLYTLIETVLGPVWVYLGGYEAPPIYAVYGGIMLIISLAIHSVLAMREEKSKLQNTAIKQTNNSSTSNSGVMGDRALVSTISSIDTDRDNGGDVVDRYCESSTELGLTLLEAKGSQSSSSGSNGAKKQNSRKQSNSKHEQMELGSATTYNIIHSNIDSDRK